MNRPILSTRDDVFVRRVLLVAAIALLALLMWSWRHVFLLLFGSVLIAIGLNGIAHPIAKRTPLNKGWALGLSALLVLAALLLVGWFFGSQVGAQIDEFSTRLPDAWLALRNAVTGLPFGLELVERFDHWRNGDGASGAAVSVFSQFGGWTLSFASAALDVVVVIFAAAFFAVDPRPYRQGVLLLFPDRFRGELLAAFEDSGRALRRWLAGTLVSMLSIALMVGFGLFLLDVPAFAPLALIAGLAQFVPLIGPVLASGPGILLAMTVGPETALWKALIYLVASQVEANLIYPMIQKKAVDLPPALTLFSIIAFGLLFGPLGILFAVPLTVVASIFVIRLYVNNVLGEDIDIPGGEGDEKPPAG